MRKKIIVYRIGDDDRPASDEDIRDFKRLLNEVEAEIVDMESENKNGR